MAELVQAEKKIALLHRYPANNIQSTNAAFKYLCDKVDVLGFKGFNRVGKWKMVRSIAWIFYAPFLVLGKGYDVIYCDDSFPFYPILIKLVCPKSKVVIRMGDLQLMYHVSGRLYDLLHKLETVEWKMVDRIIAISDEMADFISKESGREVDVAYDPVEPSDFHLSETNTKNTVMFHGTVTKNKGLDIYIEAARLRPEYTFKILGDGEDRERLEKIAPSNVKFLDWQPFKEVCKHITDCNVGVAMRGTNPGNEYVVTSPYLQYSIMAKPCVVSKRKVFKDYAFQFTNAENLASNIDILMRKPEFGKLMRDYILMKHTAKKVADKIWSVLLS